MMKFKSTAAVTAVLALSASPAFAVERPAAPTGGSNVTSETQQAGTESRPAETPTAGTESRPAETPTAGTESRPAETPTAENNRGTARKLAAPGRYCKDASKKRVQGEKHSAFSVCVKAQSRLRGGKADSPREACKGASKKRVKGEKGTAFSSCVKAAAKLLKDQKAQQEQTGQEQTQDDTTTTQSQA